MSCTMETGTAPASRASAPGYIHNGGSARRIVTKWQFAQNVAIETACLSAGALFTVIAMISGVAVLMFATLLLRQVLPVPADPDVAGWALKALAVTSAVSTTSGWIALRLNRRLDALPLVRPLTRWNAPQMPAGEALVRPAEPPNASCKASLLRAPSNPASHPEQLLRTPTDHAHHADKPQRGISDHSHLAEELPREASDRTYQAGEPQ